MDPRERERRERRRLAARRRVRRRRLTRLATLLVIAAVAAFATSQVAGDSAGRARLVGPSGSAGTPTAGDRFKVPRLIDPHDVYAADRPGMLAAAVRHFSNRIY